jgi:hypothetical protein
MNFGCLNSKRQKFLVSSWFSLTLQEVINKLNLSRSEDIKASELLLQSSDFLGVYSKIDLMDPKACMTFLSNKVFTWMLNLHRSSF